MRIAAGVEYDGTAYNGWQKVSSGIGIQAVVEKALTRVANHDVEVHCAGRTDAGVHASGQVFHFDTTSSRSERSWLLGANSNLPDDIGLNWVHPVPDSFHARYSATARTYRYLLLNRLVRSPLCRTRAWWVYETVDTVRMQAAARYLVGEFDFSAFRAADCQARHAVRELREMEVIRQGDWIIFTVTGNAFLQHMVRNIVGTLVAVGKCEYPPDWVAEVLKSRDRRQAGVTAPAAGLTLIDVVYPDDFQLPDAPRSTLMPGEDS